jgi:RNA polymerase sigma-70 factor (ECF subfamily)
MNATPTTRYSLLLRIADPQNQAAWIEFVTLYEPLVYSLARRKGLQDCDARDLCQEVFRSVAGAGRRWTPDPARGSFRGYLYRIARNKLLNFLRHKARHPGGVGGTDFISLLNEHAADQQAADETAEREYRREVFRVAAAALKPRFTECTWQAFWRTAVEEQAASDVAAELKISVGAVYIARSRVAARLRQFVEQIDGSGG